jgi:hypothetical protein
VRFHQIQRELPGITYGDFTTWVTGVWDKWLKEKLKMVKRRQLRKRRITSTKASAHIPSAPAAHETADATDNNRKPILLTPDDMKETMDLISAFATENISVGDIDPSLIVLRAIKNSIPAGNSSPMVDERSFPLLDVFSPECVPQTSNKKRTYQNTQNNSPPVRSAKPNRQNLESDNTPRINVPDVLPLSVHEESKSTTVQPTLEDALLRIIERWVTTSVVTPHRVIQLVTNLKESPEEIMHDVPCSEPEIYFDAPMNIVHDITPTRTSPVLDHVDAPVAMSSVQTIKPHQDVQFGFNRPPTPRPEDIVDIRSILMRASTVQPQHMDCPWQDQVGEK